MRHIEGMITATTAAPRIERPNEAMTPKEQPMKMSARNVDAYFSSLQALYDVSLEIPENQVLAIIGPSGCGKSTFLRCLNRMHEVAGGTMTGTILLDGEKTGDEDPVLLR